MSGRRRNRGHQEEHHVDERWLVSYSDMITVLMALFIVLFAMSTVDQHKYDELKNSLATGFGVTKTAKIDENKGVVPKKFVKKNGAGFSQSTIALQQVAKEIQDELNAAGAKGKVSVKVGSKAITISLVGSRTYFDGNDASLRPQATTVLRALSPALRKHAGAVTVEGHADPHGSAGTWGNDWNLAAARANSVLVWLVGHGAIDAKQISSVSFGSENAKRAATASAVEHNRRVDIVVHTVQSAAPAASTSPAPSSAPAATEAGAHSEEPAGHSG